MRQATAEPATPETTAANIASRGPESVIGITTPFIAAPGNALAVFRLITSAAPTGPTPF
jgi:hypothetical protein